VRVGEHKRGGVNVLNFVLTLHQAVVWVVLALGAACLVCGLALLFVRRGALLTSANAAGGLLRVFRVLLAITAGLGVLQAIFGVLLLTQGCRPHDNLHYVYGIIVLAAVPVAYVYSDQGQVRRDVIILSIAAAAIIGAAIRAFVTGSPGSC
jgi:hypothetical protein